MDPGDTDPPLEHGHLELPPTPADLSFLFEQSVEAVIVTDTHGAMVLVNARAEELFGYAPGELLGQSIEVLVTEPLRGRHAALRTEFAEDRRDRPLGHGRELLGRHRSGRLIPIEISLTHVRSGDSLLTMAIVVDVGGRKQAEALWREREQRESRLRLLHEAAIALAHHVRNAVAPILMRAEMSTGDDRRDLEALRRAATENGERIAAIVDALLDLSTSGRTPTVAYAEQGSEPMLDFEGLIERHVRKRSGGREATGPAPGAETDPPGH